MSAGNRSSTTEGERTLDALHPREATEAMSK